MLGALMAVMVPGAMAAVWLLVKVTDFPPSVTVAVTVSSGHGRWRDQVGLPGVDGLAVLVPLVGDGPVGGTPVTAAVRVFPTCAVPVTGPGLRQRCVVDAVERPVPR